MGESMLLNKGEMISWDGVNLKIGGGGNFLYTLHYSPNGPNFSAEPPT
jgi:hypothetical protein